MSGEISGCVLRKQRVGTIRVSGWDNGQLCGSLYRIAYANGTDSFAQTALTCVFNRCKSQVNNLPLQEENLRYKKENAPKLFAPALSAGVTGRAFYQHTPRDTI